MAQVEPFSKNYLPHVVRLFFPDLERADSRLDYFNQQLACLDNGQAAFILKDENSLRGFAHLMAVQRDRVFISMALARELDQEQWEIFWNKCAAVAGEIAGGDLVIQTLTTQNGPEQQFLESAGFKESYGLVEFASGLEQNVEYDPGEDFTVTSLAESPDLETQWIEMFNQGITPAWNQPPFTSGMLEKRRKTPGFIPEAFRLGLVDGQPTCVLFYQLVDKNEGIVSIHTAATASQRRGRGFGRLLLKETLLHLREKGYKKALCMAESRSHAITLLFKMLGLKPETNFMLWEHPLPAGIQQPPSEEPAEELPEQPGPAETPEQATEKTQKKQEDDESPGFYSRFHLYFDKDEEDKEETEEQ